MWFHADRKVHDDWYESAHYHHISEERQKILPVVVKLTNILYQVIIQDVYCYTLLVPTQA